MPYAHTVWSRDRWKNERDGAKVPKGAVKGVSVGDELDKFDKAHKKSLDAGAKQANLLKSKLAKYASSIKAKHPEFAKTVSNRLIGQVDFYLKFVQDTAKARAWYPSELEKARSCWMRLEPEFKEWKSMGRQGEPFEHNGNKALVKALTASLLKAGNAAKQLALIDDKYKAHGDALAKLGSVLEGSGINGPTGDKIDDEVRKKVT